MRQRDGFWWREMVLRSGNQRGCMRPGRCRAIDPRLLLAALTCGRVRDPAVVRSNRGPVSARPSRMKVRLGLLLTLAPAPQEGTDEEYESDDRQCDDGQDGDDEHDDDDEGVDQELEHVDQRLEGIP